MNPRTLVTRPAISVVVARRVNIVRRSARWLSRGGPGENPKSILSSVGGRQRRGASYRWFGSEIRNGSPRLGCREATSRCTEKLDSSRLHSSEATQLSEFLFAPSNFHVEKKFDSAEDGGS